jgi:hypothetical protein
MRHYTIKMMNGFALFNCALCKHFVTTREFSRENGSCRTQAAIAMNEHARAAHGVPTPVSSHGAADVASSLTRRLPEAMKGRAV